MRRKCCIFLTVKHELGLIGESRVTKEHTDLGRKPVTLTTSILDYTIHVIVRHCTVDRTDIPWPLLNWVGDNDWNELVQRTMDRGRF